MKDLEYMMFWSGESSSDLRKLDRMMMDRQVNDADIQDISVLGVLVPLYISFMATLEEAKTSGGL